MAIAEIFDNFLNCIKTTKYFIFDRDGNSNKPWSIYIGNHEQDEQDSIEITVYGYLYNDFFIARFSDNDPSDIGYNDYISIDEFLIFAIENQWIDVQNAIIFNMNDLIRHENLGTRI